MKIVQPKVMSYYIAFTTGSRKGKPKLRRGEEKGTWACPHDCGPPGAHKHPLTPLERKQVVNAIFANSWDIGAKIAKTEPSP